MGTRLISQRKGRRSAVFASPSHRFVSDAKYPFIKESHIRGQILRFVQDPSKDCLLAEVLLENKTKIYLLSAEGMAINDIIEIGTGAKLETGNILPVEKIPDGISVFNLEGNYSEGGSFARSSGSFATIISHDEEMGLVSVRLPSKKLITVSKDARATIGIAAGAGRIEKPLKKAGNKMRKMKSRNKYYPIVRGTAMSAYDHPHGGRSFGFPTTVKRSAPPGQKTGHIAARKTGRTRGKIKSRENQEGI